jgi:hypothetical protein
MGIQEETALSSACLPPFQGSIVYLSCTDLDAFYFIVVCCSGIKETLSLARASPYCGFIIHRTFLTSLSFCQTLFNPLPPPPSLCFFLQIYFFSQNVAIVFLVIGVREVDPIVVVGIHFSVQPIASTVFQRQKPRKVCFRHVISVHTLTSYSEGQELIPYARRWTYVRRKNARTATKNMKAEQTAVL